MNGADLRGTIPTIHQPPLGDHGDASAGQIVQGETIDSSIRVPCNRRMAIAHALRAIAVAGVFVVGLSAAPAPAHADNASRIAELGKLLETSSNAKTRISAVASLSRMNDKRAWKTLVVALKDPSATVRALAASALGKLGHKGALPALGDATTDTDETVRKRAEEAIALVRKANDMPEVEEPARAAGAGQAGFGNSPRAVEARPDLYVTIKSASDDSPGTADKAARKQRAEYLKNTMASALSAESTVTNVAADATKYGLDLRSIDLSVVKLEHRTVGNMVEVEAQLRLAISDKDGKMLSFLSNGATIQVAKKSYSTRVLPQLQQEALENAVQGLFGDLLDHLRRGARS
jgi:hypothetical protein